jgi:ribonuclease G
MSKEVLIHIERDEIRAAVLEDDQVVELYMERPVQQRLAGSIYKGRVENVLPGMQAAFVNIGLEKNAFLYISDALTARGNGEDDEIVESMKDISIKDLLHQGQPLLVQISKEPIGTKGARVTTHVTLPGRYLVLMPTVEYVGVSRRIDNEKERERLKSIAAKARPSGMGLIVRTVAEGKDEEELINDARYLTKLWKKILSKEKAANPPVLIHKDLGLVERIIRDVFSAEVDRLIIDSRSEYTRILELVDIISPELKDRVELFPFKDGSVFDAYEIETEIEKASRRKVWLKCGGYVVVDRTEALTVIDVNTGKFVGTTDLATTVLKTNLEAAKEIARQIRLRNIGGIIIIDFIDMEHPEHREQILSALEDALRRDRTKANVLGITQLGLVEITRKKTSQGLDDILFRPCPTCDGRGRVLSEECMSQKVEREVRKLLQHTTIEAILIEVHPSVAGLLIGVGGNNLKELERETGKHIFIKGSYNVGPDEIKVCVAGSKEEVEERALPVRVGQIITINVDEPHTANPWNGIGRMEGYVIDVDGGGELVGEQVKVEITKVFRTYAKARLCSPNLDMS